MNSAGQGSVSLTHLERRASAASLHRGEARLNGTDHGRMVK